MATSAPTSNVASLHGGAEDGPAYRAPPHNTEIEAALLGAILTNNRAYERVSDFLRSEHFAEPVLGRIYAAAEKLIERSAEHTFELQSLMRTSYALFCLKTKDNN